jgi:hypothetical protein
MPGGGSKPGERRGGRAKGTPNKVTAEVKAYAGRYTKEAITDLVAIARNTDTPPAARIAAWREVLDRGVGKAAQSVDVTSSMSLADLLMGRVRE